MPPKYSRIGIRIRIFDKISSQTNTVALLDQIIVSSSNFLTGVIIGRACVKEEFGLYMLGFTILIFMKHFQYSLISLPYTVYIQRLKGNSHARYSGSSLIQQLTLSVLFTLILAILGLTFSSGIGMVGLDHVIWALALFIIFISLRDYIRSFCFALMDMKNAFVIDFCIAVLQIGGLFLLIKFKILSAQYAYWLLGIVCAITVLTWLILNRQNFSFKVSNVFSDFWKNFSMGKWILGSQMTWILSIEIFPWIIAIYHGVAATAVFAGCRLIVNLTNPLLLGIQNYLHPLVNRSLSNSGIKEMDRIIKKYSIYLMLIGGSISILLILIGESLIVVVYGNKYAGNGLVISFLALFAFARLMSIPFSTGLIAMEIPNKELISNILGLLLACTFGLWITNLIGPTGAAFGLFVVTSLSTFSKFICYKSKLQSYI